jgi:hypothetical protein
MTLTEASQAQASSRQSSQVLTVHSLAHHSTSAELNAPIQVVREFASLAIRGLQRVGVVYARHSAGLNEAPKY